MKEELRRQAKICKRTKLLQHVEHDIQMYIPSCNFHVLMQHVLTPENYPCSIQGTLLWECGGRVSTGVPKGLN